MKTDQLLETIQLNKESGFNFRERRHAEWAENYSLYRDRVIVNRLTQRQSVNVPLMKSALNTLRKDIDDAPALYFHNLDGDSQKEVYYNEGFRYYMKEAKGIVKDIQDKNNAMLFGRTFKKLNICDGVFDHDVVDPQDINIDRYVDPAKLDTARFLIQEHIYKPLSVITRMSDWDTKEINKMRMWFASEEGLIQSTKNARDAIEKNQRMQELGVIDTSNPVLGETYVELNECYVYLPDKDHEDEEILHVVIVAQDQWVLLVKPLCDVLGETYDNFWHNHFPYTSWGVDPDRTDFWCDGISDILRTPNKLLNTWFSQEVEHRTLMSYGMNFYDSSNKSFMPQTFQPLPWGFYPTPGDPNKILRPVFPQGFQSNLDVMQFVMNLAKEASAATNANQGQTEKGTVTLGEVQLALSNAKDRVRSMAIFYNDAWEEFGQKYVKLLEGAQSNLDPFEIVKSGRITKKQYKQIISPKDWQSKSTYRVEVRTVMDKQTEDAEEIQKLQATQQFFPENQRFHELLQKKAAEFAGLNAEEIEQVMEIEREKQKMSIEAAKKAAENLAQQGLTPTDQNNQQPNGQAPQLPSGAGAGNQPALPAVTGQ